jgi:hypothetical protein
VTLAEPRRADRNATVLQPFGGRPSEIIVNAPRMTHNRFGRSDANNLHQNPSLTFFLMYDTIIILLFFGFCNKHNRQAEKIMSELEMYYEF